MSNKKRMELTQPLHHAYGIIGDTKCNATYLVEFFERELGVTLRGNPDVWQSEHEVFGIDEARSIRDTAGHRAVGRSKRLFMVACQSMTWEAQNALLKTLEEPAPDVYFFLLFPSAVGLLPTLRSRLRMIERAASPSQESADRAAQKFLHSVFQVRLEEVRIILKELEGGKRDAAVEFLDALESTLAAHGVAANAKALSEIFLCKKYVRDRAPSFKLLLEHLALVLPVMK